MSSETRDKTISATSNDSMLTREEYMMGAKTLYTAIFVASVLGVITNAINIRVFLKQGLSGNSSSVSLFFLALSDFGACATLVPTFTCTILDFMGNIPGLQSCIAILEMPGPYTHVVFNRLSGWITGYLSVERGLSVLLPLKVKTIFQPKVTMFCMICMTAVIILGHYAYPLLTIEWVYDPFWNTTMAVGVSTEIFSFSMFIQNHIFEIAYPCLILSVVIPSLILIVITLRKSNEFREKSSNSNQTALDKENKRKSKERGILKAIAIVWGVYIVCQTLNFAPGLTSSILKGAERGQANFHLLNLCYIAKFLVDNINASTNLFIYITVSSSYKVAFQQVFRQTLSEK